jgi:hypothetical protein
LAKTTRIDTVNFTGRSGRAYEFRIYVWDTKFKPLAGVYIVAARSIEPGAAARYESIFIAGTNDLSKTFKDHARSECFEMYYANVIGVLRQDDEDQRTAIVTDLLEGLAPPCNAADAV